jgi:two-component system, cell cycle sensor histidine kinase and response regulator CckA
VRILLIEDNEDEVCLIRGMLLETNDAAIDVEWVEQLDRGLTRLAQGNIDLVLLDLSLPDSQGLESVDRVWSHTQDVPIIVLTGLDDEALASRAVRSGAQDYLVKGRFDRPFLMRALRYAVERKAAERALRRTEAQLHQVQKMELIGQLAGGLAHDLNNLLTVINGHSEMLSEKIGSDNTGWRNGLDPIKDAGQRAASLTRRLLDLSRRQAPESKVLDLNDAVSGMGNLLRQLIGKQIDLALRPHPGLGRVRADPGQVEQIIMNLAVNARDAMPGGGQLTIETMNVELDSAYALMHQSVEPGSYVMLAVSDTGCGMDAATQARLFEPFFTTKEPGKGTGLGLATVYGIVKQSKGNIWVYSEPGRGTTFKIYLPRLEEDTKRVAPAPGPDVTVGGSETVLLVEDQEMVRTLARTILQRYGYTVVTAPNGHEALRIAHERPGPIHLLLTDAVMPGMNGPQLAGLVRSVRSDMKVLYMSGYTDGLFGQTWRGEPGIPLLQKPFTPQTLARKVREVLGVPQPTRTERVA